AMAAAVGVTAFAQVPAPANTPVASQPAASSVTPAEPAQTPATQPAVAPAAPTIANAALPRDLSPWGMFLNADIVVKVVMLGLIFASLVTWTVWLAKKPAFWKGGRRGRAAPPPR